MSGGSSNAATEWTKEHSDIATVTDGRAIIGYILKFDLDHWVEWLGDWGISRALVVSILFFGLVSVLAKEIPNLSLFALEWLVGTSPIWLPVVLVIGAWKVWLWYVRALNLSKWKTILLEMKVPREVSRSPRAMELALTTLWSNSGETTFVHRWWQGGIRQMYSFEIASFGGDIHFYIWLRDRDRRVVEASMYAQYPEIELHEVEDYAVKYVFDPKKDMIWGNDYPLEPRNDAYPFRTYIDFELDKDPKEEFKIDPLANVLEYMSNIRPEEQVWLQIIITYNKEKRRKPGNFWKLESRWEGVLNDEVQRIRLESGTYPGHVTPQQERTFRPRGTWMQTHQIETIERNLSKLPFSVGVRGVYIARKDIFNGPSYNGTRWIWRPLADPQHMNQLRPRRWHNPIDYAWQDWNGVRWNLISRRFFDAYRRRSYFYSPWITPHNMMSTEEIATLWHPPSRSIATPGLERIPAKKAEPPLNLPMH